MTKTPEELTKDWKEGKLEYGRYWVKNKVWEEPFIDRWLPNYSWEISCKKAIEQVLASVPNYDEYMAMQVELAEHRENCSIRNECAELRSLLKACKNEFSDISTMAYHPETHLTHPANFDELFNKCEGILTRINAALGESEE